MKRFIWVERHPFRRPVLHLSPIPAIILVAAPWVLGWVTVLRWIF